MKEKFNRILIYDGSHALHRALAQPEIWNMVTSSGYRTGGVVGVLRTILKELKLYNYFPIVVFDGGLSERRLKLYPNYKKNQEKQLLTESVEEKTEAQLMEEEFRREYNTQRNLLIDLLPNMGIPVLYKKGWEGDDLIYILTKLAKDSIVVSDDKDLLQLIHTPTKLDNRTCCVKRGMRDEFWNFDTLKEKNVDIDEYICCKAIIGDPSDNIPSACFQVGEKTAPTLYKLYSECIDNHIEFPTTEDRLAEVCARFDIPKRKAFLNFDNKQFNINYLLTDLSLVDDEIDDELENNLVTSIFSQANKSDPNVVATMLKDLEIVAFNAGSLWERVKSLHKMLDINNADNVNTSSQNMVNNTLF